MSRPRKSRADLPKYVREIHGSLYWHPSAVKGQARPKPHRICAARGEDHLLWKFMADLTMPTPPPTENTTLGELLDKYLKEEVPKLRERTQHDYRWMIGKIRAWGGDRPAHSITPKEFAQIMHTDGGKTVRIKMLAVLSSIYSLAVGQWFIPGIDRNPLKDVKRPKGGKRKRYVTHEEYAAVYKLMPARMQIAMDLAYLTGQRQGDLLSLKWSQVDTTPLKDYPLGAVYFHQSKTGKRLSVGVSKELHDVLMRSKQMVPQLPREWVLRTRKGKPYARDGFRSIWQRGMRKALNGWTTRGGKRHEPVLKERFTFHDLRAKNISDSSSLQDAMERAGHTSMAMTRGVYDRGIRLVKPLK